MQEDSATETANGTSDGFFEHQSGPFFRRVDWSAFWTGFLASLAIYVYTLAPTVTLEDSGELAVASDYLGVPHPPGYPIWTLLTWLFQWVFHFHTYYGQPNPAWSVGLASAFFGALACGVLALLVSRSGADILRSMESATKVLGYRTENLICWVCGVTGALLFALTPVLWSQSVIVEVYSLNAFFMMLIVILTYRWMCRPQEDMTLYAAAFIFGLGLTNHQSLLFMIFGLLAALWFCDRDLFRDCLAVMFFGIAGYLFWSLYKMGGGQLSPEDMRAKHLTTLVAVVFLAAPGGLFMIERKLMTEWKRVLIVVFLVGLGISFYAYMPVASEQNPPMNWGYPRTMEGFKHALSRGQYEKISPAANLKDAFSHPGYFFKLLNAIIFKPTEFTSVVAQFTWIWRSHASRLVHGLSLLTLLIPAAAIVPFVFLWRVSRHSRAWLWSTFATFFSMTVIFIVFQYPKLDVQTLFIGRVQYIQAHAIFALWISYGLMFALTFLDTLLGGKKSATYAGAAVVLLLPLVPLLRNAFDEEFIEYAGGCEQNGHDFGWQFGNWQLRGAAAILEEISAEERAAYPNPAYPPEMGTNAVFFGGTDPGRFVPTYMIYSAKVRSDVYLITQNALADNTYMNVMRDLYGDTIWIPSQQDSNFAFQKYVKDVQDGKIPPGAAVSFKDGRVSVQGVQGVMMINGILAKMIFEANKHKHDFYVEESYVIPWMYPYLEPHGLIMKICRDPLPALTPEMVRNDTEFWDWYTRRLTGNSKFRRDVVARKTFSKLRSAIAGLYAARHMFPEARYAFKQAIDLYPLSPEANFRLADVLMQQREFGEARKLIEEFLLQDPGNDKVSDFLNQIKDTEQTDNKRQELEARFSQGQGDLNTAFELADLYKRLNLMPHFEQLTRRIVDDPNMPPEAYLRIGQMYADVQRFDLLVNALQQYLRVKPNDARIWIDLAAAQAVTGQQDPAVQSLRRAIELGGDPVRDVIRNDGRFQTIRDREDVKALVPPIRNDFTLPFGAM